METIERLAQTNRWSARHTGDKLFLGGGLLLLSLVLPPLPGAVLVLAAAITAALAGARLPVHDYLRVLSLPIGFLSFSALTLAFTVNPAGPGPIVAFSPAGVSVAMAASLRALAATASLLLIILTIPVVDLLGLLRRTRLPAPLIDIILLVHRFIGLTSATVVATRTAQANRLGYAGVRVSIRSAGLLAAALLPRVLDRARRMEVGLAARCYHGELPVLTPPRPMSRHFIAFALALDVVIVTVSVAWLALAPSLR